MSGNLVQYSIQQARKAPLTIGLGALLSGIESAANGLFPYIISKVMAAMEDVILEGGDVLTDKKAAPLAFAMPLLWITSEHIKRLRTVLLADTGRDSTRELTDRLFEVFLELPAPIRHSKQDGAERRELNHFSSILFQIGPAIQAFHNETVPGAMNVFVSLAALFMISPEAALISLGSALLTVPVTVRQLRVPITQTQKEYVLRESGAYGGLIGAMANADLTRISGNYHAQKESLSETVELLRQAAANRTAASSKFGIWQLIILTFGIVFGLTALLSSEEADSEKYLFYVFYMINMIRGVMEVSESLLEVYPAAEPADRLAEYFDQPSEADFFGDALPPPEVSSIVLHNLTFRYQERIEVVEEDEAEDDKTLLRAINLELTPRAINVISGESGIGKSTLLGLIFGELLPTAGEIQIHGNKLHSYKLSALRKQIAYVPQKSDFYEGSIYSNLIAGIENATEEKARRAMEYANLGGMDINQDISNLSGGQKRRVALARAFMREDARYLLLDEPTTGLDARTEAEVLDAISRYQQETGVLVVLVSHNLPSICKLSAANRVNMIMLHAGAVVENGAPEELTSQAYLNEFQAPPGYIPFGMQVEELARGVNRRPRAQP